MSTPTPPFDKLRHGKPPVALAGERPKNACREAEQKRQTVQAKRVSDVSPSKSILSEAGTATSFFGTFSRRKKYEWNNKFAFALGLRKNLVLFLAERKSSNEKKTYLCKRMNRSSHTYKSDFQGNIVQVWNVTTGELVQLNEYFPDGTPTPRSIGAEAQPYKYTGNEWIRANGYDAYDFNARQFQPTLLRFDRPDPLAEKRYDLSPYTYCSGNPICRIDPNGLDDYGLDRKGNIFLIRKTDDEQDRLIAGANEKKENYGLKYNKKGEMTNKSILVDKNILSNKHKDDDGDLYIIAKNETAGTELFEFVADNTDVEWSQFEIQYGETTKTYLTTSHLFGKERRGCAYIQRRLSNSNNKLNYHYHSHPYRLSYTEDDNRAPSEDDYKFKNLIQFQRDGKGNFITKKKKEGFCFEKNYRH